MNTPLPMVSPPQGFCRGVVRLLAFDVRRFGWAAAVVVGLEILRAGFVEWFLQHAPLSLDGRFGGDGGYFEFQLLDNAVVLATIVGTAILAQADHPTDDRAFWHSRPIAPVQVGCAKLALFAALFVVVPTLVTSARLVAYGAPAASIGASLVQFAVIGGGIVIPAWALALVTRTLPRFFGIAAGLCSAWYVALTLLVSLAPAYAFTVQLAPPYRSLDAFAPPLTDWQRVDADGWWIALILTIAGGAIVVGYYATRRAAASWIAALALVATATLVPRPDDLAPASPALAAVVEGRLRVTALAVPDEHAVAVAAARGASRVMVRAALPLPPTIPAHMSTTRGFDTVRLSAAGVAIAERGPLHCCRDDFAEAALTAVTGRPAPAGAYADRFPTGSLVEVSGEEAAQLRDRVADVDAVTRVRFTTHRLAGDIPLLAGAAFRGDGYLVEVLSIDDRRPGALCRYTRFPALSPASDLRLSFFVGPTRDEVTPAMISSSMLELPLPFSHGVGWAYGRTWSRRAVLFANPLVYTSPGQERPSVREPITLGVDTRLFIVEGRVAGEARVTTSGRGVPVRTFGPPTLRIGRARLE